MRVAHLALELGAGNEGCHRIDHQHVYRSGADKRVGNLERLLAGIGLGNQQFVDVDAELASVGRIEGMLGIDESAGPTSPLSFGDDMQSQGRFTGALWSVYLDDTAARQAADAKRDIEAERTGGDHLGIRRGLARSELHDRALAKG